MLAAQIPTVTADQFVDAAVVVLEKAIISAIRENGQCTIGLSGGSTPGPVYEKLGRSRAIDWEHVHIFLVDERCVPSTDEASTARLIGHTLLRNAPVPDLQRHFPDTTLPPADAADVYDALLRALLPDGGPDVVVLGLGRDGHTASLFPPLTQADVSTTDYVIHTRVPPHEQFPVTDRLSTTLRLLRTAGTKVFLLSGAEKHAVWEATTKEGADPRRWPASLLLHHAIAVTRW